MDFKFTDALYDFLRNIVLLGAIGSALCFVFIVATTTTKKHFDKLGTEIAANQEYHETLRELGISKYLWDERSPEYVTLRYGEVSE